MAENLAALRSLLGPRLVEDAAVLAENATDFGRLIQAKPMAVARPADAREVAAVVRWARGAKIPLVTRGKGHSQSGLSLAEGAVVLDLSALASVGAPDPSTGHMRVGGGAAWRDVAAAAAAAGRLPPVLTNNLGVSVGGTLSVAGLGISSFRHGCQGDQVVELDVVTGTGDLVTCSAEKDRELFDCVRSGLGLFGVITAAVIRTVPVLPKVRTYYLLYDDLVSFMKDAQKLMTEERFGYIESWCVPSPQGFRKVDGVPTPFAEWFFPLHASVEFRPGAAPDDRAMLAGLGYYRKVHVEDRDALEFAGRLEPLFELWKRAGYWAASHPWMETVLPWEAAMPYITGVLGNLPPHVLGGGHILLWPSKGTTSTVPLFMKPKSEFVIGFGVLPGLPSAAMATAGPLLQRASDLSLKMGAKRYPSGWLGFDAARWKAHYGEKWPAMVAAKKRYDPDGVLHPGLLPLEE